MAYVCGVCACQQCKLNGGACKEIKDICKECNGSNPPKCKYGKLSLLDKVLGEVTGNKKIDSNDTGCCATDCDYKNNRYCTLYNAELYGTEDNPTRCGDCFADDNKSLGKKLVDIWNEEFPDSKVKSINELHVSI